jgi:hypothetical protein
MPTYGPSHRPQANQRANTVDGTAAGNQPSFPGRGGQFFAPAATSAADRIIHHRTEPLALASIIARMLQVLHA